MPLLAQRSNWRARRMPGTAFNAPSGLLVDEVANEAALASHPDVLWYATPSRTSPTTLIGSARDQWWATWVFADPGWAGPGDVGVANDAATHTLDNDYGVYVTRFGSPFSPDNYYDSHAAGATIWANSHVHAGSGAHIQAWAKWFNSNTMASDGSSGNECIGSTSVNEAYFRFMIYVDADVEAGMTEFAMKLSGFEGTAQGANFPYGGPIMGYLAPVPGSGRVELSTYAGTIGEWRQYPSFSPPRYLNFNAWHSVECYSKMNSDENTSDAVFKAWLDDVLIEETTGRYYTTSPSGFGTPVELARIAGQIYHGGQVATPTAPIHHKTFGFCVATRRIGKAKLV